MTTSVFLSGGLYSATRVEWPDGELTQEYPYDRESSEVYTLQADGDSAIWSGRVPRAPDPDELNAYKIEKRELVDTWTETAILTSPGFEFPPGSGYLFSLSIFAQSSWHGMANLITMGRLDPAVFPTHFHTKDDEHLYVLTSVTEAKDFYEAGTAAVLTYRYMCQAVKAMVMAASTYAEIDAVVAGYAASLGVTG